MMLRSILDARGLRTSVIAPHATLGRASIAPVDGWITSASNTLTEGTQLKVSIAFGPVAPLVILKKLEPETHIWLCPVRFRSVAITTMTVAEAAGKLELYRNDRLLWVGTAPFHVVFKPLEGFVALAQHYFKFVFDDAGPKMRVELICSYKLGEKDPFISRCERFDLDSGASSYNMRLEDRHLIKPHLHPVRYDRKKGWSLKQ